MDRETELACVCELPSRVPRLQSHSAAVDTGSCSPGQYWPIGGGMVHCMGIWTMGISYQWPVVSKCHMHIHACVQEASSHTHTHTHTHTRDLLMRFVLILILGKIVFRHWEICCFWCILGLQPALGQQSNNWWRCQIFNTALFNLAATTDL